MSGRRNIFAYTAPCLEPAYLSLNLVDGELQISLRSPKEIGGHAMMTLPREKIGELALGLVQLMVADSERVRGDAGCKES